MPRHYLACDLGAESGRLIHGTLDQQTLSLTELHRFPNIPIQTENSLHWNINALWRNIQHGLTIAAQQNLPYAGLSCNSWGVDYILLNAQGQRINPTFHYRDPRTTQGQKRILQTIDRHTIFAETGIQHMPINTLCQLAAEPPQRLNRTTAILGIADAFNALLSNRAVNELSLASTFQLYNPTKQQWSKKLLQALNLKPETFPPITPSGTPLANLTPDLQKQTNLPNLPIIATCSHDTAAAIAAVPATGNNWAYLSSGTWSLMGVEQPTPNLSDTCHNLNFTNEIGYNKTTHLLKNISGLWLLQESLRHWKQQNQNHTYTNLIQQAQQTKPFQSLINPMDPRFIAPTNMPQTIQTYCQETNQPPPNTPAQTTRCILESLALLYRQTIQELETLTKQPIHTIHIVGGGSKNTLLNQLTANATQKKILAGPTEATATGNITIQALALNHLKNLTQARQIIKNSNPPTQYLPQNTNPWQKAAQHFQTLPTTQTKNQPKPN